MRNQNILSISHKGKEETREELTTPDFDAIFRHPGLANVLPGLANVLPGLSLSSVGYS